MVTPNPIMGTGLHALGGISAASCYLPYQKTKWSWGSFWIVQANFAWVIVPLVIAFLTVPDLVSVFRESPPSAIFLPMLLGAIYGFGGMSFGFAIRHIGYSMTYTLAIGISSIVGFLVPLILAGHITEFFTATGGGTLLIGIFLSLTGIFLCGAAGYKKERFLKSASTGAQSFNMGRGLALTVFAGILSGIFGVGLELAQPIADVAASHGAGHFEGNARIIAPSIGCYITNIIWFVVAGIKNKSIKELNPKNAGSSKDYTRNFLFSALGGSLWYIQFFFYGVGHVRMGKFMAASWVIHMSMLIFFSYIVGILMKEWKNLKKSIIVVLIAGLLILLTSFIVMSIGTLQAEACNSTVRGFEEVTESAGIDFIYNFGDRTYENILESSGSGITIFDYDGDGHMDLYMMNGTWLEGISDEEGRIFENSPNRLYRNLGNGFFEEESEKAGVDDRHWSMAAGAMDYDLDGDQDLYLLNYGPNVFYENNGEGAFVDRAPELGLVGPDSLNGFVKWSVGVSFLDYNQDGLLDAFVGNFLAFDPDYVSPTTPEMMPHPSEYKGQASLMYEQQTDGTFKEVTEGLGLLYPDSKCMGLTVYDFDVDGDLDIFQGNDHQSNFMFKYQNRTFHEVGVEIGVAVNSHGQTTGSMHGAIGDVDGDGMVDLLVPDLRYGALYHNRGDGTFEDITESSGIEAAFSGKGQWASALFDYDNDGDLDLFSANGTAEELILQYPLLMENDGEGNFTDVGKEMGSYFGKKRSGRAAAIWDYDNDGDLDVIVSHVDLEGDAVLLRNNLENQNSWLGLTLEGVHGPMAAIGARVTVHAGDQTFVRINQWTSTYLTNSDPRLHLGLGEENKIDEIEIYWSDGTRESFPGPKVNQYLILKQGSGHPFD